MSKKQSLGIDLGTSNCAVALSVDGSAQVLDITQITGANRVGQERTFASALYLPGEGQFAPESLKLPWTKRDSPYILGNFAREIGAQVPDRLITSAKSWLCTRSVDPQSPLLPWKSSLVDQKLSPFEATRLYLEHLRRASILACQNDARESALEDNQIVLTVPASFDEAARKMTAQAAVDAGWGDEVVLLEEPQAAFYAWLGHQGGAWREQVKAGDLILICDVGGGTTDFSLIAVTERDGNLQLERISVGRHILLGGDNMDLALAHALRREAESRKLTIDDWQFMALIHASRKAKEQLFADESLPSVPIAVPSRGSSLLSGTITVTLERDLLNTIAIDGFFAKTAVTDMPAETPRTGLQEFGLAYASDPVISKHLAEFLTKSLHNVRSNESLSALMFSGDKKDRLKAGHLQPDAVLFNGGVFKAKPLRDRVLEILALWAPGQSVTELVGTDFDLAVAQGAAIYGYTKITGKGVRIRAGVARSYYIGLEPSMPAIPGYRPPIMAVCVAEQGMEEGQERILTDKEFGLVTGTTVTFRFFSAVDRAGDVVGIIVPDAEKELEETSSLEMTLPAADKSEQRATIPVKLHARLSELGVLQLWMQHTLSSKRWELTFSVRTK
jgi:hypothetical protein